MGVRKPGLALGLYFCRLKRAVATNPWALVSAEVEDSQNFSDALDSQ